MNIPWQNTTTNLHAKDLQACWDEYQRLRQLAVTNSDLQLLVDMAYDRWLRCSKRGDTC